MSRYAALKIKASAMLDKTGMKETLLHAKNYLLTSIATQGISLVSIPIFTYLLTTADYGVINLFGTYVQMFAILMPLNLYTAVGRYYYEDQTDFDRFLGTSISISAIMLGICFTVLCIFRSYFARLLQLPDGTIIFFLPAVSMVVLDSIFMQVFMPSRNSKIIMKFSTWQTYISFAISVTIIYSMKADRYLGRLWTDAIIFGVFGVLKMRQLSGYVKLTLDKKYLKYIFSFSLPLIPYLLSGVILSQFDRIMINKYHGESDTGLYSFAYNLSTLQLLVSNALYNAWMPDYYKYYNEKRYDDHDRDVKKLFNLVSLSAVFFILFGYEIGMVLGSRSYHSALHIIPIVLIGHWFMAVIPIYSRNLQYKKMTWVAALVSISAGILNIYLNTLFIPKYGNIAAAYTTSFSQMYLCVVGYLVCKLFIKLHTFSPLHFLKPFLAMILTVVLFYTVFLKLQDHVVLVISLKILTLFAVAYILYRTIINQLIAKSFINESNR